MPRRENTFRVDYSQFPKQLSHDEIHKFIGKELGLTRENVMLLQPSRRLGCTFVEVSNLELAEKIVQQHDNKHEFVFDGKAYKLRITMEDGAVEVRLFDLSNDVTNAQIAEFLADYGEVLSTRDLLWDDRSIFGGVKTGVRIVRMVVKKNIPSLITIRGEETSVGYKGQRQTCLHCQEFVHVGIPCVQNKKLLVQKLAADQSYANVTKQRALSNKSAKPNNLPKAPEIKLQPKPVRQLAAKPNENRTATNPQANAMGPPAAPLPQAVGLQPIVSIVPLSQTTDSNTITQRMTDGNDTDCSQNSTGTRRSRNKRLRHNEVNTTHSRESGDDMQL